ncbi:MAG: hypothetical protein H0U52_02505, partial [Chloroflexi bacterium]|nr:hypothetical protein [Chloroflexota bacterium]
VAAAAARPGTRTDLPWPRGLSAQDDDGLRVSSALAQRDAVAVLPVDAFAPVRLSLARAMHGLVLRHGFSGAELDGIVGPWRAVLVPPSGPAARRRAG